MRTQFIVKILILLIVPLTIILGVLILANQDVSAATLNAESFESASYSNLDDVGTANSTWDDVTGDACNWTVSTVGSTPSGGTGPDTQGAQDGSNFIYIETSAGAPCNSGDYTAILEYESTFNSSDYNISVSFYYHMYGAQTGSLYLDVNDGDGWVERWSASGDLGNQWNLASVDLSQWYTYGDINVRLRAVHTGSTYRGDISIDNIVVSESSGEVPVGIYWDGNSVSTNFNSATHSNVSVEHTVSGNNTILLVFCQGENQTVSSVTFGSNSLTNIPGASININGTMISSWYMVGATGTEMATCNYSVTNDNSGITAISYTGVSQVTPLGALKTATANNATITQNLTTTYSDSMIVEVITGDGGDMYPHTETSGQTERWDFQSGTSTSADTAYAGYELATTTVGTYNLNATQNGGDDYTFAAIELIPYLKPTLHDIPFNNEETYDTTPSFEFTSTDPSGTSDLVYQIEWDDNTLFSSPTTRTSDTNGGFENTVDSGDTNPFTQAERMRFTIQPSDALSNDTANTNYFWHVRSKPNGGSYGSWSEIYNFRVNSSVQINKWLQTTDGQFATDETFGLDPTGSGGLVFSGMRGEVTWDGNAVSTNFNSSTHTSISVSHTVSGSDTILLVFCQGENQTVSSVTFGATSLTNISGASRSSNGTMISSWYAVGVTGTATATCNLSSQDNSGIVVISYNNVDQSSPIGAVANAWANSRTVVQNFTTNYNFSTIVEIITGAGGDMYPHTQTSGQTERWDFRSGTSTTADTAYAGYEVMTGGAAGTFALNVTQNGIDDYAYAAIELKGVMQPNATAISSPIEFNWMPGGLIWDQLIFADDETGGDIKYTVEYWDGDSWELTTVVDEDASPVDISGISYKKIRLVAYFTATTGTPTLNEWSITWIAPDYAQNDFEWFVPEDSVTLTNAWPPGSGDNLSENTALTAIPATNEPLVDGRQIRLEMNLTISASKLIANGQRFKLQFAQSEDCTAVDTWEDIGAIGSASVWRLFDEASIGDSTVQVNDISTSTASAEGYYSEISPTDFNPNEVLVSENMEWDWPIEANGVTENSSYCFRMIKRNGTEFLTYNADGYPKITIAPGVSVLMRHGNFYQNDIKRGFFWAN